jgi:hypothetical protein
VGGCDFVCLWLEGGGIPAPHGAGDGNTHRRSVQVIIPGIRTCPSVSEQQQAGASPLVVAVGYVWHEAAAAAVNVPARTCSLVLALHV